MNTETEVNRQEQSAFRSNFEFFKIPNYSSSLEHTFDSAPNTEWVIRVRSENDAGPSAWSPELRIKTADGIPGPVKNLDAEPRGPEGGRITWDPPDDPNGEISGYSITYQLKSIGECGPRSSQPFTVESRDTKIDIDGLIPDATYEGWLDKLQKYLMRDMN